MSRSGHDLARGSGIGLLLVAALAQRAGRCGGEAETDYLTVLEMWG